MAIDIKKFANDPLAFAVAVNIPTGTGTKRFGEVMEPFQRERFQIFSPSILAVARGEMPPNPRVWVEGCKGSAKSMDLAVALIWLLSFSLRPLLIQAGAGDQGQSDELRQAMRSVIRVNPWLETRLDVQRDKVICSATGAELWIITSDALSTHGSRPDVVVANELSHVDDAEFIETLFDNLSKMPFGLGIVLTNSGLLGSWQHRWKKLAVSSPETWTVHETKTPPPWISQREIEQAKRRNSHARFMRLYYCVWSSGLGDALDQTDIDAAIDRNLKPLSVGQPGWQYVVGIDLGLKSDHSALVVLGVNRSSLQIRLAEAVSWAPSNETGRVDLVAIERYCLEVQRRFNPLKFAFDPWNAALLCQRLSLQGCDMFEMIFTGKNLSLMATTLLDIFRSRRITMYDCPRLITDLGRLQIEEKAFGQKLTATRDENGHADLATALSIALPLAVDAAGTVPVRVGAVDLNTAYDGNLTPLQRYLKQLETARKEHDDEMRLLSGSDPYCDQNFVIAMQNLGSKN